MKKIHSDKAPAAIGPYSQGIEAGSLVFVSGQLPIDPTTGRLIEGGIEAKTLRIIDNIAAILQATGLTLENVVKTEVYLLDLSDFQAMNRAYASRFTSASPPARQAMQVARLPLDASIEISCIAYRK